MWSFWLWYRLQWFLSLWHLFWPLWQLFCLFCHPLQHKTVFCKFDILTCILSYHFVRRDLTSFRCKASHHRLILLFFPLCFYHLIFAVDHLMGIFISYKLFLPLLHPFLLLFNTKGLSFYHLNFWYGIVGQHYNNIE